ncbi:MAG: hypothetical protein GWO21_07365, partial [Gammaproteobacteria bacterium]|nr:hypothetical protein [Gammaproteobacteria bacterium]
MTSGSQLAFRARNRAGTKYQSAFFDVVGNFAFDTKHGKFSFYYGFYDPKIVAQVLATSTTISL